jgi:hypothetical protein
LDGRRFSGTFSSARGSERVIAVFSRSGAILLADDDGHTHGTMLAPNRMGALPSPRGTNRADCFVRGTDQAAVV